MVLLAGYELLLHRLAGQEDILVGSPIAGRARRETENMVGFFLNTLVLRTGCCPPPPSASSCSQVRETVLGATAHQELPFEKLLIELQPERQLSQTPFFQVFFNMANIPDLRFELPGLAVEMLPIPEVGSKFDLNLYVFEGGDGGLEFSLVYNPDLFDRARVREILGQLELVLQQALADPEQAGRRLRAADPGGPARLPDPRGSLPEAWPGSVPDLFAARAHTHPHAIAVEDDQVSLTYGELLDRATAWPPGSPKPASPAARWWRSGPTAPPCCPKPCSASSAAAPPS